MEQRRKPQTVGLTTPRAVSDTPQATRWGNIWRYGYRTSLRSTHAQNLPCGRVNETSKDQITAAKDFSNQSRMATLDFRRYHDGADKVKTTQRFFKSKQSGCFQFQKISRQPRRGKNNTKIFKSKQRGCFQFQKKLKQHSFTWNSADILKIST